MGLFGKKKRRRINPYKRAFHLPIVTTREYRLYKHKEEANLNWYEKLIKITGGTKVSFGKESDKNLQAAINFTGLRATPEQIGGLMLMTIIVFVLLGISFMIVGLVTIPISLGIVMFGVLMSYYFYIYPKGLVKTTRIKASSQVVLAILYMVVSMRISPNVERALRFAASNITGPLAWDLRRLLWDIEMRKYYSASEALDDYIVRWKVENEEFAEALRLIRDSQHQTPKRALAELDRSLDVILEGTKTRMKHYAQDLLMPVMVIHMMGIVLPILGTIMAPLAAVFLSDKVSPIHFIIGYDIVLPIVIIWFINSTLSKRPMTLSQVDISKHPNIPKGNSIKIGKTTIPVLPIAILVLALFLFLPITYFAQNPDLLLPPCTVNEKGTCVPDLILDENYLLTLIMSSLIILGFGISIALYYILSNIQKNKIYQNIEQIESEFELALFKLGNKISAGTPTELAIEKSLDDVKDLKIYGLFKRTLINIKTLGMTFEAALFDKKWGAMRYYPSRLIENIMYAVIDTSKKGTTYASESMLRISKYLKNIRETQEYIKDLLTETVSSMKFQAYFLTPLITGMIVAMADIIIQIIVRMGIYMEEAGFGESIGVDTSLLIIGAPSVSPAMFQLIIGIYVIEVIMILGMFLTKITSGDNKVAQRMAIGKMLIVGIILYFTVAVITDSIFGDLIAESLRDFLPR